ncbi:MAG: sulfite exporter TauE/SafE family protein [Candidatus Humimicrobiaceae bacterium]
MTLSITLLILLSTIIGFLGSLTGLGGASILVPILVFFGIPIKEAIAAGMIAIIGSSSGSALSYVRNQMANVRLAMFLEIFTVIGGIAGATLTVMINPVYLYFFFVLFLATSFIKIRSGTQDITNTKDKRDFFTRWLACDGAYYDKSCDARVEYYPRNTLLGGAGMFVAGLAAGMLGIGAGAFKTTVQENILRMPTKVSSATSNFIIGMTALGGTSVYLFSGLLNLSLMAPIAIGTTIGAVFGGRILNRIKDKYLKILFLIIVSILIIQMLYKGITSIWNL